MRKLYEYQFVSTGPGRGAWCVVAPDDSIIREYPTDEYPDGQAVWIARRVTQLANEKLLRGGDNG